MALAGWADILLVAVPGGAGTLVDVARGSVVDEGALIAAPRDGRIANAGRDVFLDEPHPDPALAALPDVTLHPHHASGTRETRDRMAQLTPDDLDAFFAGRPLLTPVN